ncbi:MAG: hypothetical protein NTV81_00915 [Candidatus Komeilibacteria bacterium]|nr:hypothetical protein [Candidatus Komeilibacteria bacterium]
MVIQKPTLGGCLHCLGLGFSSQYQSPRQPAGIIKEISYVSGAACLYRLGHLKELGFFDERLFLYHEDLDCGWLSRLRGGQSFSLTTPIVYHHYKFSRNPAKYYYLERNRWLVLLQNYHWLTLLLLSPLLVAAELFLLVQAFKDGWLKQKLTAYGYFCSRANWRLIIDRRQFVQSLRKCPDYLVTATFCTNFNHTEVSNWVVNYLINPLVSLYWKLLQGLMFW